jgi:hypothetical protein
MALLGKYTNVFIFKPHQTANNRFDKYLGTITKVLQNLSLTKNKQSCFKQIKEQNRNQKNRKIEKKEEKKGLGAAWADPGQKAAQQTSPNS